MTTQSTKVKRVVIIGGGLAGASTASGLRKGDSRAR